MEIKSSNYPSNYQNREDKQWAIQAATGQIIIFEFSDFSIEYATSCIYDWVQVFDGNGQELLKKSCGDTNPQSFSSKTNKATVMFHSDVSVTGKGFRLKFSFKEDSAKHLG